MQPVREALPYSYQSWIVVYILQDSTGKINIFLPDLTIFLPPPVYLPPLGNVPRARARFFRCTPLLALVGAGVPDGPLLVLLPKGYFALRRDTLLPTAAKGCKNAAKNQWFLEFLSSDCSCGAKRFRNESPLRLPSLPLTWHAESNGRPSVWAIIKSRTCRQRRQVSVRPAGPRPRARNIPFENKSAGRCGRRVRAQRPPQTQKRKTAEAVFLFGSELSSN